MTDKEIEQEDYSMILPIICNHCGKEIEVGVKFDLLVPKEKDIIKTEENVVTKEAKTE